MFLTSLLGRWQTVTALVTVNIHTPTYKVETMKNQLKDQICFKGLAAGTLLFITFFEVLARDKLNKYGMSGILGAIAVICGYGLMAGLEVNGHSHGHGHHGHEHEHLHEHEHGHMQSQFNSA